MIHIKYSDNQPTHLLSIQLQQRSREYKIGKRQSRQPVVLEQTAACKSMKLEVTLLSYRKIKSNGLRLNYEDMTT